MPTLISRGVASAKAFGLTGTNKGQLYTVVFTSNGTFTPMPGLTTITQVVGQGGSSTSDYVDVSGPVNAQIVQRGPSPGTFVLPKPWSEIADSAESTVALLDTGGDHSTDVLIQTETYISPDDKWKGFATGIYFPYYTIAGTWSLKATGIAPIPVTGDITSYSSFNQTSSYYAEGDCIFPGSVGSNTTAFGYTFTGASKVGTYPNATGQSATPVTYNNVPINPTTSYPIVVGAGGYVQLTFVGP